MRFWKSRKSSSALFLAISAATALILSACNPTGQTTIGTNYYPGITVSSSYSTVSISTNQVLSGNTVSVTVSLKDQNSVPFVSNLPAVTLQQNGGTSSGIFSAISNNGDGTYSATFSALTAGTATNIIAAVDGVPIITAPSITVISGNFSLANSVVSVSSNNLSFGSTETVTLTVKDSSGNPSTAGGLAVAFANSGGSSLGSFSAVTDHQNGTYTATFLATTAGTATNIIATIQGQSVTHAAPTITVNAFAPILSYASSAGTTGAVGTAMTVTPSSLTTDGSAITGCAIKAATTALPGWATLNTTTCVITGTPTATQSATTYTINATNAAGTSTDATVSLTVNAGVPVLSYSGSTGTSGTVGTAFSVTPTTLANQGAAISGCAVKASTTALPGWATLNTNTCVITGTPNSTQATTTYTIDAVNAAGTSTDATVSISVGAGVPVLSYGASAGTSGVVGTAMSVTPSTLNNQGSAITGCAIKATTTALPGWATLNTTTCVITGTPTATQAATTYTINATNASGSSTDATVSLTVTAGVPLLSYSTSSGTSGTVGTAISVTPSTLNNQGSAVTGCAIKASTTALPLWATLNTTTCVITGTPTATQAATSYTIDATNASGTSTDATVSLTVTPGIPVLSYSASTGTAGAVGTAMSITPSTLNNQGSAITGCAIKVPTTTLPGWATLNTTSCVITGTPTATQSATTYTINATNAIGNSVDATVSITVGAGLPVLSYSTSAGTSGSVGTAMSITPSTLSNEGSAITGCAIKVPTTNLPGWATLNATTCVITGTPNATQSATTYTIDAVNAVGTSTDATVSITVAAGVPVLSYSTSAGTTGSVGTTMSVTPSTLNNEGASITGCAIKASTTALPGWASLNTTTCVITGTPTGTLAATSYTIDATNSAGTSTDASVTLTVNAAAPSLSYATSSGTAGTVGTAMSVTPSTLASDGSAITACAIKGGTTALPGWATLNSTTCVISGTPTSPLSSTSYTIDATNAVGTSTDASVSLSAVYPVPTVTAILPTTGSYGGGTIVTLTGTGFYSGIAVAIGGTACGTLTVNSTSSITCTTGSHANGVVDVVATNTGTTGGTLTGGFTYANTAFTQNWDFGTSGQYTYNSSKIQFGSGLASLTPASQTDNSDANSGFGGGSLIGTAWDTNSNAYLRLDQTGMATDLELDSSWTPAWPNLVGYWRLNGSIGLIGNNVQVASTVGPNLLSSDSDSTLAYAQGELNQGLSLDGNNDFLSAPWSTPLNNSSRTLMAWVKTTSSANQSIFGIGQCGSNQMSILGAYGGSVGYLGYGNDLGVPVSRYDDGRWHHIVVTFDGSIMNLYLDAIYQTSSTKTLGTQSGDVVIGRSICGDEYFNGQIDEVAIWNTNLSASAVTSIYQHQSAKYAGTFTSRVMDGLGSTQWTNFSWKSTLPFLKELPDNTSTAGSESTSNYSAQTASLMNGIVGLWHLDENGTGSGPGSSDFRDASGNGHHLTASGPLTPGIPGKLGSSVNFFGSSASSSWGILTGAASRTIMVWFKTTSTANFALLDWGSDGASNHSSLGAYSGNIGFLGYGADLTQNVPNYNDGNWHQLATTYDGSAMVLYMDGNAIANSVLSLNTTSSNFYLGSWASGGLPYSGSLDEVGVWSRSLSSAEILELYRRGANRIKYQVRSCGDATCSTSPSWLGPDGTNQTYFSELNNNAVPEDAGDLTTSDSVNTSSPTMSFANFSTLGLSVSNNRYFQYRAIMESDDTGTGCNYGSGATWCSPELQSVAIGPNHYDTSNPTIVNSTGVNFATLTSLHETLGTGGCGSGTLYNLSPDGTNWYYLNGGTWTLAGGTVETATAASLITPTALSSFPSPGTIYFKVFLQSSGTSACTLSSLAIGGTQ